MGLFDKIDQRNRRRAEWHNSDEATDELADSSGTSLWAGIVPGAIFLAVAGAMVGPDIALGLLVLVVIVMLIWHVIKRRAKQKAWTGNSA